MYLDLDRWGPSPLPKKGAEPPNFWPMSIVAKQPDGSRWHLAWRWAWSRPHCIRWGPSFRKRGIAAPLFSAHVYCGHSRPSQLLLSSCYWWLLSVLADYYNNTVCYVACLCSVAAARFDFNSEPSSELNAITPRRISGWLAFDSDRYFHEQLFFLIGLVC